MKWVSSAIGGGVVLSALILAIYALSNAETRRLAAKVEALETERKQLADFAQRLGSARRVAQVEVLRQRTDERGRTVTTVLWQEIGASGVLGRPLAIEAIGTQVYVEALVLKFERELLASEDPNRGVSLALFRRLFGDQQAPDTATEIDRAARPPLADATPADGRGTEQLWRRFWELVDEPARAAEFGVRVAQIEAPSVPMKPGQLWEVSLETAGGLNLRLLGKREASAGAASASGPSPPTR